MAQSLIVLTLLLATVGSMLGGGLQTPAPPSFDECETQAEAKSQQALQHGASAAQANLAYQTQFVKCRSGADPEFSAYAAAIQIDLARLARQFLAHYLPFSTYIAEVQDRRSKLRQAEHDRAWVIAYQSSGDKDGDFVPDSRDHCPNSPPDSLTDIIGCPTELTQQPAWIARRPTPDPKTLDRIAASIGYMAASACTNAPAPQPSEPVHQGFIRNGLPRYSVTVTRVQNQPEGCQIFYQIEWRFLNRPAAPLNPDRFLQVTFRDNENQDHSAQSPRRRVFQVTASMIGLEQELYDLSTRYSTIIWRVRSINGNGLTSGWSPAKTESFDGVYDPLK